MTMLTVYKTGKVVELDHYRGLKDFKCWDGYLIPRQFDYHSKEDYIRLYPLRGIAEYNLIFQTAVIPVDEKLEIEIKAKKEIGRQLYYYTRQPRIMNVEVRNVKNNVQTVEVHLCIGMKKNIAPEDIRIEYCKDIVEIMRLSLAKIVGLPTNK